MIGLILAASLTWTALGAPEYQPVTAELVRPRDGLPNVFAKLERGEPVTIAYFGGSITAAAGWRPKTTAWFKAQYPAAAITEIDAAIGGTGSDLGAYRFAQDVLAHNPDLVFIEYSVNDGGASPENIWRGMEAIVRQAWTHDPTIDLCYVYTFRVNYEQDLDRGLCPRAAGADEMLADYYGIPSINFAMRIAEMAREGKLIFKPVVGEDGQEQPVPEGMMLFSKDGVHPLAETGHQVYLEVLAEGMAQIKPVSQPGPHELKPPYIEDHWQAAKLVPLRADMLSPGWRQLPVDEGLGQRFSHRMKPIWEGSAGDTIRFKFKGTTAKLYDLVGPDGGQIMVTVDGQTKGPIPRFDHYCTYHRLSTATLASGLADTVHEVAITISESQPDRSSVTDREKDKPGFDPAKYDGTKLRIGGLLLMGDIVE